MSEKTRRLTTAAMLAAIAYIFMAVGRFPLTSVEFLKYDPKDIVIAIGGFIMGPFPAFLISLVVSFFEMITVSSTGPWGFLMNVLSTCALVCPAAWVYQKKRTLTGAVIGLAAGVLLMTGVMILWNYLITPIYMGYPRETVAAMLVPIFLPFNLVKGTINAAATVLLYQPVVTALRRAHLIQPSASQQKRRMKPGVILIALVVLATCILYVLVARGII